jgi:hypothetical protein
MRFRIDLGDKEKRLQIRQRFFFGKEMAQSRHISRKTKKNCQTLTIASRMLPKHSGVPKNKFTLLYDL